MFGICELGFGILVWSGVLERFAIVGWLVVDYRVLEDATDVVSAAAGAHTIG